MTGVDRHEEGNKMRYTEYHNGVAVIKDKALLKEAMAKLAKYEDAVEALEKQILKKPIEHETKFAPIYECPSCGYIDVYGQEHCDNCGQRLDWSE